MTLQAYRVKRWHDGGMKVVLRADASSEIGTGHVMRQVALAEELLLQGAEVFLVGEVRGPSWLEDKLTSVSGLQRIDQTTGTFDSGVLQELGASVSAIDSYALGQSELAKWEAKSLRTVVFIDGPWQRLEGGSAVVPAISDKFGWLEDLRRSFDSVHSGPEFLMIRSEIRRAKQRLLQEPPYSPQILVVLGGADPRGLTAVIESAVLEFASEHKVVIVGKEDSADFARANLDIRDGVIYSPRSSFLEELAKSTLVISAAGTTSGELLFLGIPSIFIPVADNQAENAWALESLDSSLVLYPDAPNFQGKLLSRVIEVLEQGRAHALFEANRPLIDGLGAQRVASLLLG